MSRRFRACKQSILGVAMGIAVTTVFLSNSILLSKRDCVVRPSNATRLPTPPQTAGRHTGETNYRQNGSSDQNHKETEDTGKTQPRNHFVPYDEDDTVARALAQRIRIVCIIITAPQNLDNRAVHVRDTWGRRCTRIFFFSSEWSETLPAIGLNVSEGRNQLTPKHNLAFQYVASRHADAGDWFLKADDDTYVIMENLRYLLSAYDPREPVYFGQVFKPYVQQGYAAGGSGVVLSKEAFLRFGAHGLNKSLCRQHGPNSDIALGQCLERLGVRLLPALDAHGKSTFHSFDTIRHVRGVYPDWYKNYDPNGSKMTAANMSKLAISFHYTEGPRMHELEYFIYHLMPYGILPKLPT